MSKQLKSLFVIVPICFALSGFTVFLYFMDPEFEATPFIISSMVLVAVWAFFIVPSLPFAIGWAKNYCSNLTYEKAFQLGYLLGCGWSVFAVLFLLMISPVSGSMWFVQTIKALRSSTKIKRDPKI